MKKIFLTFVLILIASITRAEEKVVGMWCWEATKGELHSVFTIKGNNVYYSDWLGSKLFEPEIIPITKVSDTLYKKNGSRKIYEILPSGNLKFGDDGGSTIAVLHPITNENECKP